MEKAELIKEQTGSNDTPAESGLSSNPLITEKRRRLLLVCVAACGLFTAFSSFKFVPMQQAVMSFFNIEFSAYGYLNTAASWFMLLLMGPAGYLVRKVPCKWIMLGGFLVLIGGGLIEVSARSFVPFVIGRMLEGCGSGFVMLMNNSLMANLVPRKRIGFWASLMIMVTMVAQVIHTRLGTWLMLSKGLTFQNVFLLISGVQLLCLVFCMIAVPAYVKITGVASSVKPTREQTMRVYKNPSLWLTTISNIFYSVAAIAFSSYVVRYLAVRGMDPAVAAKTYSYTTLLSIPAMLIFGWLSDRLHTKRKIAIFSFICAIVAFQLLLRLPIEMIYIYVLVYGTLPRSIAGMASAAAPDFAEVPADIPIVNSTKNIIAEIGGIIAGIGLGYLVQYGGYEVTINVISCLMAAGAVCWLLAKKIP